MTEGANERVIVSKKTEIGKFTTIFRSIHHLIHATNSPTNIEF